MQKKRKGKMMHRANKFDSCKDYNLIVNSKRIIYLNVKQGNIRLWKHYTFLNAPLPKISL